MDFSKTYQGTVTVGAINIVGYAIRTSFQTASAEIGPFWQSFLESGAAGGLGLNNRPQSMIAAYCEYESDYRGAYDMILGASTTERSSREDLRLITTPEGKYDHYRVKGDPQKVVAPLWAHIWQRYDKEGERRYAVDWEEHTITPDGEVQIDVFIGLKSS